MEVYLLFDNRWIWKHTMKWINWDNNNDIYDNGMMICEREEHNC